MDILKELSFDSIPVVRAKFIRAKRRASALVLTIPRFIISFRIFSWVPLKSTVTVVNMHPLLINRYKSIKS